MSDTEDLNKKKDFLNARLDRLPILGMPSWIILVVGIGEFFAYYDIIDIGLALPSIESQLSINSIQGAFLASLGLLGLYSRLTIDRSVMR